MKTYSSTNHDNRFTYFFCKSDLGLQPARTCETHIKAFKGGITLLNLLDNYILKIAFNFFRCEWVHCGVVLLYRLYLSQHGVIRIDHTANQIEVYALRHASKQCVGKQSLPRGRCRNESCILHKHTHCFISFKAFMHGRRIFLIHINTHANIYIQTYDT